eukprot:TRINITY_DN629_c0_g1_i3.p1 TRINITY_DN629_c0_g1~~TRINITY_DN629_c0_g1_i3.p1  ORF type:complete len:192 (-),score=30.12 TRINITY_DN629_c0_g1_i3:94-669(-)
MGYPVLPQPPMPATGQPHLDSMSSGLSSCHIVNGVPAPGNFHHIRLNSGNVTMSAISEMPVSPASVASSGHFPFTSSEMSGMGVDTSALDTAFASDITSTGGLQLGSDGGASSTRESLRSLAQIPWNFSFSDLTADLTNLGDLGDLRDYTSSPLLPSESDILLDSPEQGDIVEYFADSVPEPCFPSDEEKS